jgi:hypothetical protein
VSNLTQHPQSAQPSLNDLTAVIFKRLRAEGIRTLDDWQKLSPERKRSIFGVTAKMIRQLDALAGERP